MTPQSLKDPRAEAAAADPAVELAREYRAAIDRLNAPDEIADDDTGDFHTNVTIPFEEKLARTRPTTREGIIETLGVAAWGAREISDTPPNSVEAMVIGVVENARDALKAGAGVPHGLEGNDAALMVLVGEFNEVHDQAVTALDEWEAEKERVEALPDCPPYLTPAEDRTAFDLHMAFLEEHGVRSLGKRHVDLRKRSEVLTSRIFATPAQTVAGATEKLKIVRLAVGNLGEEDGDMDLNADQPDVEPRWFARVILDFERLSQPAGDDPDDPFPAWLAEWEAARATYAEGTAGIVGDRRIEELDEPVQAAENKIITTPTRTIAGVVVKLRMLAHLVKEVEPPDTLVATVLAGAESIMRGPGVVVGGDGPDPLVVLYAKWHALEWHEYPEGLTAKERESFTERTAAQADEVATEIISAPPDTLVGAFAQIALLAEWAEGCAPAAPNAVLKRLFGRVKAVLQDAAEQGATS